MRYCQSGRSFFLREVVRIQLLVLETCSFWFCSGYSRSFLVAINRLYILVGSYVVIDIIAESSVPADSEIPVLIAQLGIEAQIGFRQCTLVGGILCFCCRYGTVRLYILAFYRLAIVVISLFCQIESIRRSPTMNTCTVLPCPKWLLVCPKLASESTTFSFVDL